MAPSAYQSNSPMSEAKVARFTKLRMFTRFTPPHGQLLHRDHPSALRLDQSLLSFHIKTF